MQQCLTWCSRGPPSGSVRSSTGRMFLTRVDSCIKIDGTGIQSSFVIYISDFSLNFANIVHLSCCRQSKLRTSPICKMLCSWWVVAISRIKVTRCFGCPYLVCLYLYNLSSVCFVLVLVVGQGRTKGTRRIGIRLALHTFFTLRHERISSFCLTEFLQILRRFRVAFFDHPCRKVKLIALNVSQLFFKFWISAVVIPVELLLTLFIKIDSIL